MPFDPNALTARQRAVLEAGTRVAGTIADEAPVVDYTPAMLDEARASASPAALHEMKETGLDFETWYVMTEFFRRFGVDRYADPAARALMLRNAKRLDKKAFRSNPYLAAVKIPEEKRAGRFTLSEGRYARGEIFQYAMPDFTAEYTVPKLGFFSSPVRFPSLYEGNTPWMSVCPSEISSMERDIAGARGRVLVLGLGLGYYPFMISRRPEVESVTVVERSEEILSLFSENLLPFFPAPSAIRTVRDDAFRFLDRVGDGEFDTVYCDLWFGLSDGAELYRRLKPYETRLSGAEFRFWIGPQLEAFA